MNDATALLCVRPEDRQRVLDAHAKLPGQSMETTVFNLAFHNVVELNRNVVSPDRVFGDDHVIEADGLRCASLYSAHRDAEVIVVRSKDGTGRIEFDGADARERGWSFADHFAWLYTDGDPARADD